MSATMALVRIQLHFMKWPLVVLTGCVIAPLLPFATLKDTLSVASALFVLIGAVVSGALIFGEEYAQGSRDYLATRPVAPMHALSVKVFMLLIYSIPAAIILDDGFSFFHPYWRTIEYERMVPLVWGLLFGLSLWCAGTAILTKDTVRGMLYGPPTYFLVCVLVWLLPSPFYKNIQSISSLQEMREYSPYVDHSNKIIDDIYVFTLLTLTPVLTLALLISIYKSVNYQRIVISKTSAVLAIIYLGIFAIALYGVHMDGSVSFQKTKDYAFDVDRTHGRLYKLSVKNSMIDGEAKDIVQKEVFVYDLWNPDQHIQTINPPQDMRDPHMVLFNDQYFGWIDSSTESRKDVQVQKIGSNGEVENSVILKGTYGCILRQYDNEKIVAIKAIKDASNSIIKDEKGKFIFQAKLINLKTGVDETGFKEVHRIPFFTECDSISIDNETKTEIYRVKEDLTREQLISLSGIDYIDVVDGNLIVMTKLHPVIGGHKRKSFNIEPSIVLCDARQSGAPKVYNINIPLRLYKLLMYFLWVLYKTGLEFQDKTDSGYIGSFHVALGNELLCVEMLGRICICDISNIEKPEWLGIAPSDNFTRDYVIRGGLGHSNYGPIKPIKYQDGIIGLPTQKGIIKIEFPALMKEAKS